MGEEEQLFVTLHTVGEEEQLFVTVHTVGEEEELFVTVHPVGEEEELLYPGNFSPFVTMCYTVRKIYLNAIFH